MIALLTLATLCLQGGSKDALKTGLKDDVVKGDWIYDDVNAGFDEAKKSGKPMLIVFR